MPKRREHKSERKPGESIFSNRLSLEESTTPGDTDDSHITRHQSRITSAYIPFQYISDSRQRIEIYRKLAQANDQAALKELEKELRDRFGPIPTPLALLLQVTELKILAGERHITVIEVKEDKLMLTRHNDFIMAGTKFPRLTKKDAPARLKEIRKLLLALT